MKKSAIMIALMAICYLTPIALCADNLKIGFVNAQRIIEESKAGKQAYSQLKVLQDEHKKKVEAKKAEIDNADEELKKQYSTLAENARVQKEEDIRKAKTDFKRMLEDADSDMAAKEKSYLEKIDKEVMEIIQKLGKEESYSILLSNSGPSILYIDPSMDITEKVIKLYDSAQQ